MEQARYAFPGKILLFGEYSVLHGSNAAVIPYNKVNARFRTGEAGSELNLRLLSFLTYIENSADLKEYLDIERLRRDIDNGLIISSSIPQHMGLGSSGAVCAAVYHRYSKNIISEPARLRTLFAGMESYFHGKSSGIDPLCIYFNKPLILINGEYLVSESHVQHLRPFLVDTMIHGITEPLVTYFNERMKHAEFATDFQMNYIPLVNTAVQKWHKANLDINSVLAISKAQQYYFERMIPASYHEAWHTGIDKELYALKICGSGGGGMLLGFTADISETFEYFQSRFNTNIISI